MLCDGVGVVLIVGLGCLRSQCGDLLKEGGLMFHEAFGDFQDIWKKVESELKLCVDIAQGFKDTVSFFYDDSIQVVGQAKGGDDDD